MQGKDKEEGGRTERESEEVRRVGMETTGRPGKRGKLDMEKKRM